MEESFEPTSLNHYEERLYSVFKTFDVDNEEALNKAAVLALCDALQLEQRGAVLVDTLFESREQRVTFAQFRSGLLAVLGDPPPPAPPPPPSDDDSSGREVAPKFVFGSKKYGRRSRPPRGKPTTSSPASEPPADSSPAALELDHSSRVDCERALQLCARLRMPGIERRLVESIFEDVPSGETTVGEFFDRLNAALSMSAEEAGAGAGPAEREEALPSEALVEAWESAGVQRPRRLLAELGFEGAALSAAALEGALDAEWRALGGGGGQDARALLLLAALVLARARRERAEARAGAAGAERERLRAALEEANRRARLLAQEVDEQHARLEAEGAAGLRRAEARHAEALRDLQAERAAERERAAAERRGLEAEAARRADAEQRLRAEADGLRERAAELEARARAAGERAAAAERERARLEEALAAAEARGAAAEAEARAGSVAAAAREAELRAEAARLRDRCDELCAQLEARSRPAPAASPPHTWHEEVAGAGLESPPLHSAVEESPAASLEAPSESLGATPADPVVPANHGAAASLEAPETLADAEARHQEEKQRLEDLVRELESSLEAMREEYERCEEYWAGKVAEERAWAGAEARAGDARLAELAARVQDYERQFAARLPAIAEAPALEAAAADLDAAAADLRRRDADLRRREGELRRRQRDVARLAAALAGAGCGAVEAELRARLARAEAGAARLAARLQHADLLVKDLYVENCLLGPKPRPL